jgi:hypothetical protein
MQAAPGSDGHLTIVSADRRKAWDMWRCKQANGAPCDTANVLASGYRADIIVQWDLTGSGVPGVTTSNTSARGSGTPILPTSLRAEEALGGINHALGLTVPQVSSQYLSPATHSDGSLGSTAVKYGMLFVLRSDYPVPANASVGVRNVIAALKTYGAYVVDQGASFQIDADSSRADLWAQAGVSENSLSAITPYDMRSVGLGGGPTPAPTPAPAPGTGSGSAGGGTTCSKRLRKKNRCQVVSVRTPAATSADAAGSSSPVVEGSIPTKDAGGLHRAQIQVKGSKGWRTVATTSVRADGTFRLKLPKRVRRGHRRVRIRIFVPGVGVSREMVVKLRR